MVWGETQESIVLKNSRSNSHVQPQGRNSASGRQFQDEVSLSWSAVLVTLEGGSLHDEKMALTAPGTVHHVEKQEGTRRVVGSPHLHLLSLLQSGTVPSLHDLGIFEERWSDML